MDSFIIFQLFLLVIFVIFARKSNQQSHGRGGRVGTVALRLRRVAGLEGRANDVVLAPPAAPPAPRAPPAPPSPNAAKPRGHTLVFFGGDVQDYPEVMSAHRDNRNYIKYNLENTARMLASSFPAKHIVVVRPSRIEYKSFSCYDNFVPSNNAGVPDHTPTHGALLHLEKLLQGITTRLKTMSTSELMDAVKTVNLPEEIDIEDLHGHGQAAGSRAAESGAGAGAGKSNGADTRPPAQQKDPLWWRTFALDESKLTLIGFSKGCVVLNQLIYEFHFTKTLTPGDTHMMRFIERIEAMYWLDGGHAGGKNTWITSRSLLETLTRLDISVFVHVSPYQVSDEGRPWIGREERAFTALLRKLGARVHRYLHEVPGAPQNLHMHFQVLDKFKHVQDTTPVPPLPSDSEDED